MLAGVERYGIRRRGPAWIAALAAAAAAVTAGASAEDWPRWRNADLSGHVRGSARIPSSLRIPPSTVWSKPLGPGFASPVVAAGRLYILDAQEGQETACAYDAETGSVLWRRAIDGLFTAQGQSEPGPRCTPLVDGDRVYVQSCLGEFRCLRVADGSVVWRTNFAKDFGAPLPREGGDNMGGTRHGNSRSAVVERDRIVVAVGSPKGASLVCFNKLSWEVLWRSQDDPPGHVGPVIATIGGVRQVVAYTAKALLGVDLTSGALLWRHAIRTQDGRHATTPIVIGDTVVVGSVTAGLIGVRVRRPGEGLAAAQAWRIPTLGVDFMSPVAVGPHVYGLGPSSSLFCIDARTGATVWVKDRFFSGIATTGYAALLVMGRNLLMLTDAGHLLLLAPDSKDVRELGRAKVCQRNWCHPAYADGRLYLRDARELLCLSLLPQTRRTGARIDLSTGRSQLAH